MIPAPRSPPEAARAWVMHVPAEREGTVQRCRLCGYVLQDVSPPPGLQVPAAEVEATAQEVPWWTPGREVLVDGPAAVELASIAPEHVPAWGACWEVTPWTMHVAGPPSPELIQRCQRCPVVLKDWSVLPVLPGATVTGLDWYQGEVIQLGVAFAPWSQWVGEGLKVLPCQAPT